MSERSAILTGEDDNNRAPGEDQLRAKILQEMLTSQQMDLLERDLDKLSPEQLASGPAKSSDFKSFVPKPGYCLKTKLIPSNEDCLKEKVFINICTSSELPEPRAITEEDLLKLIESDSADLAHYRVPMSLGDRRTTKDKSGNLAAVFDVVINPNFFDKTSSSQVFNGFFLSIVFEGLENKHNVKLTRDWVQLKNRKYMGELHEQYIRTKSKPWIMELAGDGQAAVDSGRVGSLRPELDQAQLNRKALTPKYRLLREPVTGDLPEFIIAEIELPKLKSADSLTLDVGQDRILLQTRAYVYFLDIFLPFSICQEAATAEFNRQTKLLTVTLTVEQT